MFLTVHSATGALIGQAVGNPVLAFILGLFSHFLLDRIPHFDPKGSEELDNFPHQLGKAGKKYLLIACVDSILWFGFLLFLLQQNFSNPVGIALGVVGSVMPDYLAGSYKLTRNRYLGYFENFHNKIHFDPKKIPINFFWGMVTQVLAWTLAMILFYSIT